MGPSGAGKTSMLDIIAGRKNTGRYEGHIMVDGVEYASLKTRKDVFGYVMQEETLVPELTVRESLEFSARLRTTVSKCCETTTTTAAAAAAAATNVLTFERRVKMSVEQVLIDLKLDEIANTTLGEATGGRRGISGGERKRVAIGMELVVNPPVLLLDEPTTGLDAASAIQVTSLLHSLVQKRKTLVVCTVHQPRSDVFLQFGTVMVLRPLQGGMKSQNSINADAAITTSVYYVGTPANATEFLHSKGHVIPNGMNVADMLLDVVTSESKTTDNSQGSRQGGKQLTTPPSTPGRTVRDDDDDPLNDTPRRLSDMQITPMDTEAGGGGRSRRGGGASSRSYHRSMSTLRRTRKRWCSCPWEMWILLQLEFIRYFRAPMTFIVHNIVGLMMGILVGFLYQNMQPDVYGTWNRFLGMFAMVRLLLVVVVVFLLSFFFGGRGSIQ